MKTKCLAVGIILLLVGTCIIPAIAQNIEKPLPASEGNWLYVGGSGPGNYTRIQDAIDNASDGDTVFVYNDASPYYENLLINKTINLIGKDKETTIIDGSGIKNVISIIAHSVNITGFWIQNSIWPYGGIDIYHGPNQNIPGPDGIGDTPYDLPCEHAMDWYPFIKPNGWLNQPPVANFTYTMSELQAVTFNASSSYDPDGNITHYHWDFGDGTTGDGQHISGYIYESSGTYNVTLTVIDNDGVEDSITKEITIESLPFIAVFAGLITDLNDTDVEVVSFNAKFVFFVKSNPFEIGLVIPDEEIWVSRDYQGYLGPRFILGIFTVVATEFP